MKKIILLLFLFFTISLSFSQNLELFTDEKYETLFLDKKQDSINQLLIGTKAKDFKFKTMKGDSIQLSELEGQPVIITVFFCACGPCMKEIPLFNKLSKKYTNLGVNFIAISTKDTPNSIRSMESFLSKKKQDSTYIDEITIIPASFLGEAYRYPKDKKFKNQTEIFLRDNYLVDSAPMTFFIDKEGIIYFISSGYNMNYDYYPFYRTKIEALLKE